MSDTTERIERDVQESRHRLNNTLDALGSKLSPGQILDEAIGLAQGQAGSFVSRLGRQVMENPLPTVLVAAGMVWLMAGSSGHRSNQGRSSSSFRDERYDALDRAHRSVIRSDAESDSDYSDRLHSAYAGALSLTRNAEEKAEEFKQRVAHTADQIRTSAANMGDRLTQTFRHQTEELSEKGSELKQSTLQLFEENPLVGGALSFAIGALIGAATPLSGVEERNLSNLAGKAVEAGSDIVSRGASAAKDAVETAKTEALH